MADKDIIVVGSSARGRGSAVAALRGVARRSARRRVRRPASFHLGEKGPAATACRAGPLPALCLVDGQAFEPGHIYVAEPDHHLLVRPDKVLVRRGPYENRTRSAINALFRSAARAFGGRVIGVVLTGLLDDGTDWLIAIKAAGGTSLVQDPDESEWPSMPRNAMKRDHVDHVVLLAELGALLGRLVRQGANPSVLLPEVYVTKDLIAAQEFAIAERDIETPGHTSHFSCPDCGGVLNQIETGEELRFRCHLGHAFTPLGPRLSWM